MGFFDDIKKREVKAPKNKALLAGIARIKIEEAFFRPSERGNGEHLLVTGKLLSFKAAPTCYDTNEFSHEDIPSEGYNLVGDEGLRVGSNVKVLVSTKAYSCSMSAETLIDAVGINHKMAEGGSPKDHYDEWNAMEGEVRETIARAILNPESAAQGQEVDVKVSYTTEQGTDKVKYSAPNVPAFTKFQFGYAGRWSKDS